jgi:hypothetical protein
MRLVRQVTLAAILLIPLVAQASSASAQGFACGPHLLTYKVSALDGRSGKGIRCVEYNQGGSPLFAWYGEGDWNGAVYRHIGIATFDSIEQFTHGSAADLFGNGETFRNSFPDNLIFDVRGRWPTPSSIRVTGAWRETWTLVSNTAYTPLRPPRSCGPYFQQFAVSDLQRTRTGTGLRCVLKSGQPAPYATVWLGNGSWSGKPYTHLGILAVGAGSAGTSGEASDLCDVRLGGYCNSFPAGSLHFTKTPFGYTVTGAWSEAWR